MGNRTFIAVLSQVGKAPPEVVYDVLADVRSHLEWGGKRQWRLFRLLSLDGPPGPASVGTTFTSTGAIPGSPHVWKDRSRVTAATRPSAFEFVTEATVERRRPLHALFLHRYEITPHERGALVRYVARQERIAHPFLRLSLPVIRDLMWNVGIPFLARRGLRNLVAAAEQRTLDARPIPPGDRPPASPTAGAAPNRGEE